MLRALGRGKFGEVQLVEQKTNKSQYALKRTAFGSAGQPDRQKVEVEAKALERLQHPNVVRHFAAWTEARHFCILMEFAEGGDFAHHLAQRWEEADAESRRFLPEEEVMGYFVQLCDGLAHVHAKRIVHRDLKPENIFVFSNGVLKLGDFGISRVLSLSVSELAQTVVGSPTYISPEIIHGSRYSYKTDVWSLGVLLYRIASNKFPFDANNLGQLAMKITAGSFPPLPPIYTPLLHHLVASMLQLEPEHRADTAMLTNSPIVVEHREKLLASRTAAAASSPAASNNTAASSPDAAAPATKSPPAAPTGDGQPPMSPIGQSTTARTSRIPVRSVRKPSPTPAQQQLQQAAPEVWDASGHAQPVTTLGRPQQHPTAPRYPEDRPLVPQPPPVATSPHDSECSSPSFSTPSGGPTSSSHHRHGPASLGAEHAVIVEASSSSAEHVSSDGTTPPRQRWHQATKKIAKAKRGGGVPIGSSPLAADAPKTTTSTAAASSDPTTKTSPRPNAPAASTAANTATSPPLSAKRGGASPRNRIRDIFADRHDRHSSEAFSTAAAGEAKVRRPKSSGARPSRRCAAPPHPRPWRRLLLLGQHRHGAVRPDPLLTRPISSPATQKPKPSSRSSSAARNGGNRGASPARRSQNATTSTARSSDGGTARSNVTTARSASSTQRSARAKQPFAAATGVPAASQRTSRSDSSGNTYREGHTPFLSSRTAPASPIGSPRAASSPRAPPQSPHVQNGGFGVAVLPGGRPQTQRELAADREMDRMLAAYVAEYGQMPTGIMRTIASRKTDTAKPANNAASSSQQQHGVNNGEATTGGAHPKYAGYISPREAHRDDFIERLHDAEERDRDSSRQPSSRRSPRPPLSPHVAAALEDAPAQPPVDVSEREGGDTPTVVPPTPLPENDGLIGAFASGFGALAASLGGRPF